MSLGSNEKRTPGSSSRQFLAQPLLQLLDADPGAALELHLQHRFLGAGTPEINGIDGVIGRLRADKAEADVHVVRPDLALDRVECLQRDLLGALDARSRLERGDAIGTGPVSTSGKISVPSAPPTTKMIAPQMTRYESTTTRRRYHRRARTASYRDAKPIERRSLAARGACSVRSIQTDSTGTKVLDSRYDATIEKPTAKRQRHEQVAAQRRS